MPKEAKESMRISLTKKKKKEYQQNTQIFQKEIAITEQKSILSERKNSLRIQLFEMLDKEFMNFDTSQL